MPGYEIDDETLREVVDDPDAATARIRELESAGDEGDAERIGWLGILGRLDEALSLATRAFERVGGDTSSGGAVPPGAATAAIRLAVVLQWRGGFEAAGELSARTITALEHRDRPLVLAFAHQHLGKSLFEQRRWDDAERELTRALELRRAWGAPEDQVRSSEQAIALLHRRSPLPE